MGKIVELKNVSKIYKTGEKEFKEIDNIDLDIKKGKFVVILGPSGAGKSTLLNLIGGMDLPSEGTIKIDGEDISKYNETQLSQYRAENIGFIFQFYNILPTLTVLENVELIKDVVKNGKDFSDNHLKLLSEVASTLANNEILKKLLSATSKNDIKECFI